MTKKLIGAMAMSVLAAAALAAAGETATYKSGDETVSGYLARPAGAGKHPGLVLIHHWWGLDAFTKSKAEKFAGEGYVVLAIDLYRGQTAGTDAEKAHELMRGLPEDRALRDLQAAFAYLAARPDVDAARIGSMGWCMGGGYSLALAVAQPKLAACVVYYGKMVTEEKSIEAIHAPLLGNFGADDRGITPDSVRAFAAAAKAAGKSVDFKLFDGVGHGFASSVVPKENENPQAREADARTDDFLKKTLPAK
jgi:carboxymethylenebutenolidase